MPHKYNAEAPFGVSTEMAKQFMEVAFSRNIGILRPSEQALLARSTVAIPGLGGVGGLHCLSLARTGLGGFHLADPDNYELVNCNRQFGATMPHLGASKQAVMAEEIRRINPYAAIRNFPEGLNGTNLDAFLDGVDVVVDSLDFFAWDIRKLLFNTARRRGIPVVTAAPLGFTSSILIFTPDSMSFDDYFAVDDSLDTRECLLRFAVGLAPRGLHLGHIDAGRVSLDHGQGPSLAVACLLCAALATTETIRLLTDRPGLRATPWSLQVDALGGRCRRARLPRGNASIFQRLKLWYVKNIVLGGQGSNLRPKPSLPAPAPEAVVPPDAHLEWLAKAAQQAPSGDNSQPWLLHLHGGRLEIFLDPTRDRSFFNIRQLASTIACGAAIQNVVSVAPTLGWQAQVMLLPDPTDTAHLASLTFSPWSGHPTPLGDAVWTRCTNRRVGRRRPVAPYDQDRLREAATPASLCLIDDQARLRKLARLLYLADRIRVERRDLHEYFMGMTRFHPETDTRKDGLPLPNLYAGAAGNLFLRLTRPWPAMRAANLVGLGRLVALNSRLSMARSPLAGLVCVPSPEPRDFLVGGMAIERIWLTATSLGLAFQPMTAITLFRLRWQLGGKSDFSRHHQVLLEKVWTGFEHLYPELGSGAWPVLLFRAGHAPMIRHWTPRRPLAEALKLEQGAR